jgi:hypothetical protein
MAVISAAIGLASCGNGTQPAPGDAAPAKVVPERVVPAPKDLIAAAEPQVNGIMWALAGKPGRGLFEFGSAGGRMAGSVPVSNTARSVAESSAGVLGVALGAGRSGARRAAGRPHREGHPDRRAPGARPSGGARK